MPLEQIVATGAHSGPPFLERAGCHLLSGRDTWAFVASDARRHGATATAR